VGRKLSTDTYGHFADKCPWPEYLRARAFGHSGRLSAPQETLNARVRVHNLSINPYVSEKQKKEAGKSFNGTDTLKKVSGLSVLTQAHMLLASISGGTSCKP